MSIKTVVLWPIIAGVLVYIACRYITPETDKLFMTYAALGTMGILFLNGVINTTTFQFCLISIIVPLGALLAAADSSPIGLDGVIASFK